jgi:hypothetical protein
MNTEVGPLRTTDTLPGVKVSEELSLENHTNLGGYTQPAHTALRPTRTKTAAGVVTRLQETSAVERPPRPWRSLQEAVQEAAEDGAAGRAARPAVAELRPRAQKSAGFTLETHTRSRPPNATRTRPAARPAPIVSLIGAHNVHTAILVQVHAHQVLDPVGVRRHADVDRGQGEGWYDHKGRRHAAHPRGPQHHKHPRPLDGAQWASPAACACPTCTTRGAVAGQGVLRPAGPGANAHAKVMLEFHCEA